MDFLSFPHVTHFLFLFLFLSRLTPATARWTWDEIVCGKTPSLYTYTPDPTDCMHAIAMIPSGEFTVDPRHATAGQKLDLTFPPHSRDTTFLVPAAFHYGTCAIMIDASDSATRRKPSPPENAASQMYSVVWPRVRDVAGMVAKTCRRWNHNRGNWKGFVLTKSMLGEYSYSYFVSVGGTPRELPETWSHRMKILTPTHLGRLVDYHVYEADRGGGSGG
ncbi:hypothetical protein MMC30_003681 [Trapelia coarctata]|nr:hypothetical protein [Trapelia coarctata]